MVVEGGRGWQRLLLEWKMEEHIWERIGSPVGDNGGGGVLIVCVWLDFAFCGSKMRKVKK